MSFFWDESFLNLRKIKEIRVRRFKCSIEYLHQEERRNFPAEVSVVASPPCCPWACRMEGMESRGGGGHVPGPSDVTQKTS